jgi:Rrf2 family protein
MLFSRTSQYAIQALIYIGLYGEHSPKNAHELAGEIDAPEAYLSKVLQTLCRGNLLTSNRGRQGGFSLKQAAEKVNLLQVLAITEGPNFNADCLLGLKQCGDDTACPMHKEWKPLKGKIVEMLESQTLGILAAAVGNGRYRLADIPDILTLPFLHSESD